MPTITGLAHVEISVHDLDASEAWYTKTFEMVRVFDGKDDAIGIRARALLEPKSGVIFAITEHKTNAGERFDPRRTGLDHVSFGVADPSELRAWQEHLKALGESPSGIVEQGPGFSSFTVPDPDGIPVEFFAAPTVPPAN